MSARVSPEDILRQLSDLWVQTGKDHSESGAGVLRACTMTLIVLAEETEDPAGLGETIAALMPEHPARTILVRLRRGREQVLAERVYAQCWMPFGERRQICCERIEITASDASLADLPSVLEPLVAPDLPVILWSRSGRLFAAPEFARLSAIASKVIVDSMDLPEAGRALAGISALAGGAALLGDLSWTQLTRWREMLSRLFENREYLARLPEISSVRVCFAGDRAPVFAWYMGAWVVNALAGAGIRAELKLQPDPALSGRGLRVQLDGGGFRVLLERMEDRLSIQVGEISQCTNLPHPTDYVLLREELAITRRDAVFDRTLASAARLAASSSP
ncbi:MAG: glucose-6-phosphate dehydrogenase assembly protein OpcA [Acidobacteriia bacterium]|nr:glucose-6-phosphate dehydrogenase assembly protein OpcA [Terriglobia bacterium]